MANPRLIFDHWEWRHHNENRGFRQWGLNNSKVKHYVNLENKNHLQKDADRLFLRPDRAIEWTANISIIPV